MFIFITIMYIIISLILGMLFLFAGLEAIIEEDLIFIIYFFGFLS